VREQPKRKLPKKSQRPKRRYILFSLLPGSCKTSKQAFDLVVGQFSDSERKKLGIWFISFDQKTGFGIVRCWLGNEKKVIANIEAIAKEFGPKTLRSSGTLKALLEK
jgi:RNase P/RNase MRP subunit POP5